MRIPLKDLPCLVSLFISYNDLLRVHEDLVFYINYSFPGTAMETVSEWT